ncbi:hypothetical protein ACROYT_G002678 [Oculina patagonica]
MFPSQTCLAVLDSDQWYSCTLEFSSVDSKKRYQYAEWNNETIIIRDHSQGRGSYLLVDGNVWQPLKELNYKRKTVITTSKIMTADPRQQGPVESLDTYLKDLTAKFRRINISDADKMRYFVQGLRANLREPVLLKQPKSFREAEEMARLASAVKTTMNNSNETMADQLNKLTKTLNNMAAGTSGQSNTSQQQAMQTQLDAIANQDSKWPAYAHTWNSSDCY